MVFLNKEVFNYKKEGVNNEKNNLFADFYVGDGKFRYGRNCYGFCG